MTQENVTADKIEGAIFATEVKNFVTTLDDPSIWCELELPGQEWARFILGSRNENAPQIWVVKLPPNYVVPRHYHHVHRLELVLKGKYDMAEKSCPQGAISIFRAAEPYGPLHVGEEGAVLLEVFAEIPGQPVFTEPPSEEVIRNLTRMGMMPVVEP